MANGIITSYAIGTNRRINTFVLHNVLVILNGI